MSKSIAKSLSAKIATILFHSFILVGSYIAFYLLQDKEMNQLHVRYFMPLIGIVLYILPVYYNNYYLIPKLIIERNNLFLYFFVFINFLIALSFLGEKLINYLDEKFLTTSNPTTFWYEMIGFSICFFIGAIIKFTGEWYISQLQLKELRNQKLQVELDLIHSQINPHFFFNSLNTLYGMILDKSPQALELVLRISDLMRYSLYESSEYLVSLNKEMKFIKDYVDIQKFRMEYLRINTLFESDSDDYMITPHIFIPLVENAFKHGTSNGNRFTYINIGLSATNNLLVFSIENSYEKSSEKQKSTDTGGIGLTNVKKHLSIMYPGHHKLHVNQEDGIFQVMLELSLDKNQKIYQTIQARNSNEIKNIQ